MYASRFLPGLGSLATPVQHPLNGRLPEP